MGEMKKVDRLEKSKVLFRMLTFSDEKPWEIDAYKPKCDLERRLETVLLNYKCKLIQGSTDPRVANHKDKK